MKKSPDNSFDEYFKSQDALLLELGKCIAAWSNVELDMSYLFRNLLKADAHLSFMVWDSVINFEAKLKALTAVFIETQTDKQLLEIWKKLAEQISATVKKRNKIAHSGVLTAQIKGVFVPLLVPYMSVGLMGKKKEERLTDKDLTALHQEFMQLAKACRWIRWRVTPGYEDTEGFAQQAPRLIDHIQSSIARKIAKQP